MTSRELNDLSSHVIGSAIEVHQQLGPGLLESVYEACLVAELEARRISAASQVPLPVMYKGRHVVHDGFRLDLLVEGELVVELKSVEVVRDVHKKQLLTYLRLAGKSLGLLINFNEASLKRGIVRVVNGFEDDEI